jgi:hypothetical protein
VSQKPTRPTHPAKNDQGEYGNFETLLKRVVSVPHSQLQARLKGEKKRKAKRASASRVSSDKG